MLLKAIIEKQRAYFESGSTLAYQFRIQQLKTLKRALEASESEFYEAIMADFGKSEFDTYASELALLYADIKESINKLRFWMAPRSVRTNLLNFPARSEVHTEPLGVSLVIGAWNYPYLLSLGPVIAAIAAGCCVVLKPSELPSRSSSAMAAMVKKYFDPAYFVVVEGGVPETTALLEQPFDKIFFTGSPRVGKIVYQAAARHLTPVTLELGGKSPAIITPTAHIRMAVKRMAWGKFLNAGQTCIAPDYLLVHRSVAQKVVGRIIEEIEAEEYGMEHGNYPRIIDQANYNRLMGLIEQEQVRYGGVGKPEERIISPTVLYPSNWEQAAMQQEIFGPILPIIPYDDLNDALGKIRAGERPLSAYLFSNDKKEHALFLKQLRFGGGGVNEAVMHITNPELPFGGTGESGVGNYHGKAGFDAFSHKKSVLTKPSWFELPLKYGPRKAWKLAWVKRFFNI